ncbi:Beta-glucuronidase [Pleurostoma richardsiae]|uniref:Beta-glucuronidase n=1 Tax=Pleurostoma richardsiae TaxID=41990 RepID=A0AA38RMF4_9PEZI|nr:Beta-glucuronidase [Pleurostoma richardsiae]
MASIRSFIVLSSFLAAATRASPSLTLPAAAPGNASGIVDPDFAGFAFEQASFVEYALNNDGTVNNFSKNLIAAITTRTGGKPLIRLGGTSADYARLLPGQETPALPRAEVNNLQDVGGTTIGPSFWDLCDSFPDAKYIIQTPLAITNISETVAWAKSVVEHIGIDKIQSFEPGNEPDLYPTAGLGPPTFQGKFTNATYVGNFTTYAAAISDAVEIPSGPFFQAFDVSVQLGNNVGREAYILDVPTVFGLGIDDDNIVKTVAHHYYQTNGGSASTLASGLMTRSKMTSHVNLFKPAIDWLKENKPSIPWVFSEIGNSLNPTHDYSYQSTLGSALWQVDFQLYSLSIGVARFNFQQIMHSGFDLWLPVLSAGMEPQVYSNFYAQPFVTDFVGKSGKAQVAELRITDESTGNWAAYAAFEDGLPKRLVLLNMNYWNRTSSTSARASQTISIQVPSGVDSVKVDLLSSPEGAGVKADSITYAGSQWTYASLGEEVKGVRNDSQTLEVQGGVVPITVYQSSAVLVHLQS